MTRNSLAPVQILTITVSTTLGVKILMLQNQTAAAAGRDGWISVIFGGILILASALLILYPLADMYPEMDYPLVLIDVFGKVLGRFFLAGLCIQLIINAGLSVRIFVRAIKLFLLDDTPAAFIIAVTVISAVYVASLGVKVIGASVDFMFPVYLAPLLFLIAASVSKFNILNLQPVLYNNTVQTLKGITPVFSAMIGYGSISYSLCYTTSRKKSKKWYVFALMLSIFLYTALNISTISLFGPDETKRMIFPTLTLSQAIEFPATLLERLEALVAIIWIPGVFAWLIFICFASFRNFTVFFNIKEKHKKYVVYAHLPLLYIIAVFPKDNFETMRYLGMVEKMSMIFLLGFNPIVYLIAVIKRRRRKKKCEK